MAYSRLDDPPRAALPYLSLGLEELASPYSVLLMTVVNTNKFIKYIKKDTRLSWVLVWNAMAKSICGESSRPRFASWSLSPTSYGALVKFFTMWI